jgi:hypothetical protein
VEVIVPKNGRLQVACDWSSDGRVILSRRARPGVRNGSLGVSPGGDRKPQPILQTRFQEIGAAITGFRGGSPII